MHASLQATLWNAHFDTGGVPWSADDFVGKGDREDRKRAKLADKMATTRIKAKASQSGPPDWVLEIEENQRVWKN